MSLLNSESYPRYWLYLNEETIAKAVFSAGERAFQSANDELVVGAYHARVVREAADGYKEVLYDSPYPPFSLAAPLQTSVRSRLSGLAERRVA